MSRSNFNLKFYNSSKSFIRFVYTNLNKKLNKNQIIIKKQ